MENSLNSATLNILMVVTSHDRLGTTGKKTGLWLEEFAAPYFVFRDAGAHVTIASPAGGAPPIDPNSTGPAAQSNMLQRLATDPKATAALEHSLPLASVHARDFDAVFYPGGHGPMWDLAEDATSIALIEAFAEAGKPVAAVCHGPAAFRHVMLAGRPMVKGRHVTGFSNAEEHAVKLTDVVPFLLEDELRRLGAHYEQGTSGTSFAITDGTLITGQNPASSIATAQELLKRLAATRQPAKVLHPAL